MNIISESMLFFEGNDCVAQVSIRAKVFDSEGLICEWIPSCATNVGFNGRALISVTSGGAYWVCHKIQPVRGNKSRLM